MLSLTDNETLARTGRGTPMGDLIRRYWIPFRLSSDIPASDGDPVRVKLAGESLLAFRDTDGRVGLVDRLCAHRNADLFFGRNEEAGLRCTYHGWKYDVGGKCVDMPTEAEDSNFRDKVRLRSYEVRERAGVLWAYMGPKELMPELPQFEWARVPDSHRFVSWSYQECNYAQAIEGGIDTVHSVYLHSTLDSHRRLDSWQQEGVQQGSAQKQFRTSKNPPKVQAQDSEFGVIVGARYPGNDTEDYWRFNLFFMPFYTAPPGGNASKLVHAFVPIDDVTTARWSFTWTTEEPMTARQKADLGKGQGVHAALAPGTHDPVRNKRNDYLIDRDEQRTLTYTGIKGTGEQDFSVQEGMGEISDRTREHLGVTDIGIIAQRKMLLRSASQLLEGAEPSSAHNAEAYRVRPGDTMLPTGADWAAHEKTKAAMEATW
jgi:phthalate 4,5-dioxygenase oxygenase subunit